jgi:hypothetical protein
MSFIGTQPATRRSRGARGWRPAVRRTASTTTSRSWPVFAKALACGTGANPHQAFDPDLDALDIAKPLKGVAHVDDQIAHHFDPRPGSS